MTQNHTKAKANLHSLYTDRQTYTSSVSSSQQVIEEEKHYFYRNLSFQFAGTDYRTPQQLVLFVYVPEGELSCGLPLAPYATAYEDYLLRLISAAVNQLSDGYENTHKDTREKPEFSMQPVNAVVQRRNGCIYMAHRKAFRLRIHVRMPLINGVWLNGKSGFKAVKALLNLVGDKMAQMDKKALTAHIRTYVHQLGIREFLRRKNLAGFIANGSILPRKNGGDGPMEGAVPFVSPEGMQLRIVLPDGSAFTGMGLKKGITVITGGGYSGKSTLLDSLEMGIYNHVSGDGREYVITDESTCKIYVEDGRWVSHDDISPFFSYIPGKTAVSAHGLSTGHENAHGGVHDFSTPHASGSLSQAAGIVEAVYGGSRLLLIDEDTSATNFMIRDANMRRLVVDEPIIPFTDRVKELKSRGISTVLVIGGSSEYLKYADRVLLMENYVCRDRTKEAGMLPGILGAGNENHTAIGDNHAWMKEKYLRQENRQTDGIGSWCVEIMPAGYIRFDEDTADITKMTAIIGKGQMHSLAYEMERLITEMEQGSIDLRIRCEQAVDGMFADTVDTVLSHTHKYELWLEEIRPLDLLMAVCRLREK